MPKSKKGPSKGVFLYKCLPSSSKCRFSNGMHPFRKKGPSKMKITTRQPETFRQALDSDRICFRIQEITEYHFRVVGVWSYNTCRVSSPQAQFDTPAQNRNNSCLVLAVSPSSL